ncbi:hypothetical protein H839_11754 [Parageobacillus genomosp. 1]|uniref:Uncharacterized protein n=1 Tax=Parageobacillus genomosp. 1 TaxID=1295642 RepID=A0ABC9VC99_9BACL|nr:hypothetical protein H839_11754 [Parageobacillus genomosp. 1]
MFKGKKNQYIIRKKTHINIKKMEMVINSRKSLTILFFFLCINSKKVYTMTWKATISNIIVSL